MFDAAGGGGAGAADGEGVQNGKASVLRGKRLTFSTEKGRTDTASHAVRGKRRAAAALAEDGSQDMDEREGGEEGEGEDEVRQDEGIDHGVSGGRDGDLAFEGETELVGDEHVGGAGRHQGGGDTEDGAVGTEELPTRTFLEGAATTMYTRKKTRLGLQAAAQTGGVLATSQEQWMSSHTATEEQLPRDA